MKTKLIIAVMVMFTLCSSAWAEAKKSTEMDNTANQEKAISKTELEVSRRVREKINNFKGPNAVIFAQELLKRENLLKSREETLVQREKEIKLYEQELEKKMDKFRQQQKKLLVCMDNIDKKQSDRIKHMVDVIANMRPSNAAEVLSVQDAGIAIKILGRLPAAKVSKVFNFMDKEISARLQKQYMSMKK